MNPLYNLGISLLKAGARVASLRNGKIKRMLAGQAQTFHTLEEAKRRSGAEGFDVWVHVASLGEFEQARTLLERIRAQHSDYRILVSFFSPSGYEVRHSTELADTVVYLPWDSVPNVERFLDLARPAMAIFVKYEFWGNYLDALRRRAIPTYIISAIFRPGQRFFRPGGGMWRRMLECFDHLYVQDDNSQRLLSGIGIDRVTVAGDTRFDRVDQVMHAAGGIAALDEWASRGGVTIVCGSSWEADERLYLPWLNSRKDVKAIIAPHEFDSARLASLRHAVDGPTALLSEVEREGRVAEGVRCVIVDSFGKLSGLYRHGDIALVGGGFGAGIHNINEAAVYGMPVLFGPNHKKFKEAADLLECGGAFCYTDASGAAALLTTLTDCEQKRKAAGRAAGAYIARHLGATDKIYHDLFDRSEARRRQPRR